MRILIVTPAPPRTRLGNRRTALRWARLLRALGHRVEIATAYRSGRWNLLVALHADRSHSAIVEWRAAQGDAPLVLAMSGTDLYAPGGLSGASLDSLAQAQRVVVLHHLAAEELPANQRHKVRVVLQSVPPLARAPRPTKGRSGAVELCVVGHLRPVKDPLLPAQAVRLLPPESRVRVLHMGSALDPTLGEAAEQEARGNPRYTLLGELSHGRTRRRMAA